MEESISWINSVNNELRQKLRYKPGMNSPGTSKGTSANVQNTRESESQVRGRLGASERCEQQVAALRVTNGSKMGPFGHDSSGRCQTPHRSHIKHTYQIKSTTRLAGITGNSSTLIPTLCPHWHYVPVLPHTISHLYGSLPCGPRSRPMLRHRGRGGTSGCSMGGVGRNRYTIYYGPAGAGKVLRCAMKAPGKHGEKGMHKEREWAEARSASRSKMGSSCVRGEVATPIL